MSNKLVTRKQDLSDLEVDFFSDKITGSDLRRFQYYKWSNSECQNGIIIISHGLIEYGKIYDNVARNFVKAGFIVYALDHIGHGNTVKNAKNLGNWEKASFTKCSFNVHTLILQAKKEYPELPIYLIGNDFGMLVGLKSLAKFDSPIAGFIGCGPHASLSVIRRLRFSSWFQKLFHYDEKPSKHVAKITNRKYNRWYLFGDNQYDWISSNEKNIDMLKNDNKCCFIYTISFYYYFYSAILRFYKKKNIDKIRKDIPILILGGSADGVCRFGKGVLSYYSLLKEKKFKNVKKIIYDNARHYLFLDVSKYDAIGDIIDWINNLKKA